MNILLVGKDLGLLDTRAEVLSSSWIVKRVLFENLSAGIFAGSYNLVVLCHSLTTLEAEVTAFGFRHFNPHVSILWLQQMPVESASIKKYERLTIPIEPQLLKETVGRVACSRYEPF